METEVKKFNRRAANGGKNSIAAALDTLLFTVLALFISFAVMLEFGFKKRAAICVALIITALFLVILMLIKKKRSEKRIKRERARLAEQYFKEKLILMDRGEFLGVLETLKQEYGIDERKTIVYSVQKCAELTADTVVLAYRAAIRASFKDIAIFSASCPSKEAKELIAKIDNVNITVYSPEEIIKKVGKTLIDDKKIDALIIKSEKEKKNRGKTLFANAFKAYRIKPYMLTGLILMILSFFTRYALYFRIIAMACFILAVSLRFFGIRKEIK
ncbi:MAG: hypothetical protein RRY79_00235 [Clostridia bacterium]